MKIDILYSKFKKLINQFTKKDLENWIKFDKKRITEYDFMLWVERELNEQIKIKIVQTTITINCLTINPLLFKLFFNFRHIQRNYQK